MDHDHPPGIGNKSKGSSTYSSEEEGRWGTWVMGNPAAPQTHPLNQQAATWVAGYPIPSSSNSAQLNANYMNYSAHPPSSTYQYPPPPPPQPTNPYVHASPVAGFSAKRPMDALVDALGRWGKKVEQTTRKAEGFAGNLWHHREFHAL